MDKINLEELIGSLETYELELEVPDKNKGLALASTHKEENDDSEEVNDDDVAYLTEKTQ